MPRPPAPTLRHHRRFFSRGLRNNRDIVVWLPPGYGLARRRHPVVYFQDGQNLFDPATAYQGRAWEAGERATELIRAHRIAAPILVGVHSHEASRMNEFAPTPAEGAPRSTGDAKRYARFLVLELKPFIDAHYLTMPGPRHTAVVGASMGGLVSLCLPLWHPRVFGHVAALSPSVWWDNRVLLHEYAKLRKKPEVRLWLDVGAAEEDGESVRLLRDVLVGKGWVAGGDLAYREVAGADHGPAAWAARVGPVLEWLLGRRARGEGARAQPKLSVES